MTIQNDHPGFNFAAGEQLTDFVLFARTKWKAWLKKKAIVFDKTWRNDKALFARTNSFKNKRI